MVHKIVQLARGTAVNADAYNGPVGELWVDTTNGELRLGNGVAGGLRIPSINTLHSVRQIVDAPVALGALSADISLDFDSGVNFQFSLGASVDLLAPTNPVNQRGYIHINGGTATYDLTMDAAVLPIGWTPVGGAINDNTADAEWIVEYIYLDSYLGIFQPLMIDVS